MTSQSHYEDEQAGGHEASGRNMPVRFLPGKATIKDDLQAVFEMEKEIGSMVFRVHKLLGQVLATTGDSAKSEEIADALQTLLQALADHHANIQRNLDSLKDSAEEITTHNQKVDDDWMRIQMAANVTLRSHGIDPRTLAEESESVKKLSKWLSYGQMIIVGIIVTFFSTWIMSSYSKSLLTDQKAANEELLKETKQVVEMVKKQQQELSDHINTTPGTKRER